MMKERMSLQNTRYVNRLVRRILIRVFLFHSTQQLMRIFFITNAGIFSALLFENDVEHDFGMADAISSFLRPILETRDEEFFSLFHTNSVNIVLRIISFTCREKEKKIERVQGETEQKKTRRCI